MASGAVVLVPLVETGCLFFLPAAPLHIAAYAAVCAAPALFFAFSAQKIEQPLQLAKVSFMENIS